MTYNQDGVDKLELLNINDKDEYKPTRLMENVVYTTPKKLVKDKSNKWYENDYRYINPFNKFYLKIKKFLGFKVEEDYQRLLHPHWKKVKDLMYRVEKITTLKRLEEILNKKKDLYEAEKDKLVLLKNNIDKLQNEIDSINKLNNK